MRVQDALGDAGRTDGEIEKISMEIVRVNVERPWFHPELFYSRFWKWRNPNEAPVSNGELPWPKGKLPGFITSLILVRNITVSWKSVPNAAGENRTHLLLGNLEVPPIHLEPVPEPPNHLDPIPVQPSNVDPVPEPPNRLEPFLIHTINLEPVPERPNHLDAIPMQPIRLNLGPTENRDFSNLLHGPMSIKPFIVPQTETTTTGDTVYLVAYIVQRLPKSPDPDPTLQWNP
ncbi:hypothetical protein ACFTQL_23810 [Peribacillus butanolivorans]|uniref:hypothetical protein n=1 Tax=Peribacillus butanolivorans TaxID=421767 RepID=UPI00363915EF